MSQPSARQSWPSVLSVVFWSAFSRRVYVGRLRHKLEHDPTQPRHFLTETGVGYRFLL